MSTITHTTVSRHNGCDIILYRISNRSGASIEVLNYGATLVSVVVRDRNGYMANVVLNYPHTADYFMDTCYLGSTIGRVANRIAGAQFTLNGNTYHLDRNDGENCNHSGGSGFHQKIFDHVISDDSLILSAKSLDGEGGFPGNMTFSVQYSFADDNSICIRYSAVTDYETLFSPTCHAYFNLAGHRSGIMNHELEVPAQRYLETDDCFLPTGRILPVAGTAFDFTVFQAIGQNAALKNDILKGYNAYYPVPGNGKRHLASLREPGSGRELHVFSTMPGLLFYTGDYLCNSFQPFEGLCLEAQFHPDAPNHAHFPSCLIHPYKPYEYTIEYLFNITPVNR